MYTNFWNKYFPVIKILLKRSKSGEQSLSLNQSDFEKVGLARKTGNKFSLVFKHGKIENIVIASPLAAELTQGLLHDETVKGLFAENDYRISLNSKFQLLIEQLEKADVKEPGTQTLHPA